MRQQFGWVQSQTGDETRGNHLQRFVIGNDNRRTRERRPVLTAAVPSVPYGRDYTTSFNAVRLDAHARDV